ncbi:MAG: sigma 54-interacting transcriptional regulator [Desulfobacterales bacterium]|jgi:formate hydrogenlyase transcriptional activator
MRQSETHLLSEMKEELQFEKLLIDISTHFVNLPADRIDDDIKEAQHRICKYLDLDRSALWQFSNKKPGEALLTHVHQPPEARFPDEKLDAKQAFPWVLDQVLRNGIVAISSPSELPPEAARDRESFQDWGVRSSVVVPLSIGGKVVGALSFARLRGDRDWPVYVIERFLIVAQVFANALVRKQAEESVKERLEFESLLADISTRFVNLPAEQIDGEIEDAHRRVCECFSLDFSALWQLSIESPRNYTLTHSYRLADGPALPERMTADEYFPWCLERVEAGEVIAISTENSPAEAARDQEVWRQYGIKSSLVIPLSAGGEPPIGAVSFNTMKAERTWPEPIVKQLQLVAQIFANALARKHADAELRKSEARLSLATNAAGVGLWIMEIASGCVWVTPKTRELLHLAPEEDLVYETFLKTIHPEDRERIDQEVVQVIQSGEKLQVEYRIVLSDGSTRWIAASGQLYPGSTGEPESLMGVSVDISERNKQMQEIVELKRRLENENLYLRKELRSEKGFEKIVGKSKALNRVITAAKQVATTEATVLILGETGTGKGLMANAIHQLSARRHRPLITVNCSALPQNLIESELFGREKGAFTGAHTRQAGRFEVADGGTIFLDEIGEMPLELQAKLLRVLQEGEFERLGSAKTVRVDVRVIAATSRDLRQEVHTRRFREDLYYRLNVFPISIPPLRQRSEDIPLLARHFVEKYGRKMLRHVERIPETTIKMFLNYDWPGNVRELEHVVERGVILSTGRTFRLAEQLRSSKSVGANDKPLKDLASAEREHILRVLQETSWRIDGPFGAAAILKLHPSTLRFRIKKLGIRRPV